MYKAVALYGHPGRFCGGLTDDSVLFSVLIEEVVSERESTGRRGLEDWVDPKYNNHMIYQLLVQSQVESREMIRAITMESTMNPTVAATLAPLGE